MLELPQVVSKEGEIHLRLIGAGDIGWLAAQESLELHERILERHDCAEDLGESTELQRARCAPWNAFVDESVQSSKRRRTMRTRFATDGVSDTIQRELE
jgi:hypothetical protein